MKKLTFLILTLATTLALHAQVAINTTGTAPDNSAMLDVQSTTKGMLVPRTDTATVNNAGSPATGLTIFQSSDNKFYYYSGSKWEVIAAGTNPVFERNGTTIRQVAHYGDDFIIGRDALPANGESVTDTLLFYDKSKGAFRAGVLYNSNNWSPDSIGIGSVAFGYNTKAKGLYSAAWGYESNVTGDYSTAWGFNSFATGNNSTAWGDATNATGYSSTAWGASNYAGGDYSTVWGVDTYAKSAYETALGQFNTDYTPASTTMWNANDRLFQIGNGTSSSALSNALTIYKNGDFILSRDKLPTNGESVSDTLLFYDKSKGAFRAGVLYNSNNWSPDSIGIGSVAFGKNTKAKGLYSTAWGYANNATGNYSTAWGNSSDATGNYSTAWGWAHATGDYSTAWGNNSHATGDRSTAWGNSNNATGNYSTAWGNSSDATGNFTTAWGWAHATGDYSTAWGSNTYAKAGYETALGQYNKGLTPYSATTWDDRDVLFVIGNGSSSSNKHNALTLWKDGRLGLGDAYQPTYALQLPNDPDIAKGQALANVWATYSDSRIKFNQKPLQYGLTEIMKLKPKSYIQHSSNFENGILNINNNSGKETIGLIAQEVYEVIPEASNKPEDENKELWSMDYIRLIPVLIKGMQQQQQTIEKQEYIIQQQKEENQSQNQTIVNLEQRLQKLEKMMK